MTFLKFVVPLSTVVNGRYPDVSGFGLKKRVRTGKVRNG